MKNHCIRSAASAAAVLFLTGFQLLAQPVEVEMKQPPVTPQFSSEIKPQPILAVMQRVADWQLAHGPRTGRPAGFLPSATRA